MPITTTRITADTAQVTVSSNRTTPITWIPRYLSQWRTTAPAPAGDADPLTSALTLQATVDKSRAGVIADAVIERGHRPARYAGADLLLTQVHGGPIYAVQPNGHLAYHYCPDTRHLQLSGLDDIAVALAAVRLTRDMIRAQLQSTGWTLLRMAAVVKDGRALLITGASDRATTAAALHLATTGWHLLALDRVFARSRPGGGLDLLPWPASAQISLGLLDDLKLYEHVRRCAQAGERLHPDQDPNTDHALASETRMHVRDLTCRFYPDQLRTWLRLTPATEGTAAGILLPRTSPGTTRTDGTRLHDVLVTTETDDRYPDVFGLGAAPRPEQTAAVRQALEALPHWHVPVVPGTRARADIFTVAEHLVAG
ncbi:hypothetical protein ACFU99_11545 [Streptomyces sp. NPDC057654]|uniref:hypothetical protein n=1 Tax=Streptomyces sp. NPDC057654 TaxID=3346196 RepID=UPI0036B90761